jgi:hypothetical protein
LKRTGNEKGEHETKQKAIFNQEQSELHGLRHSVGGIGIAPNTDGWQPANNPSCMCRHVGTAPNWRWQTHISVMVVATPVSIVDDPQLDLKYTKSFPGILLLMQYFSLSKNHSSPS